MGVVEVRQGDVLPGDVAPHVEFGEVRDREYAHVLAIDVATVVEVPQFGALVARIPLAEFIAQGEDALLGSGLVLVTAGAAEDRVVSSSAIASMRGWVCRVLRVPSARSRRRPSSM